MNHSELTKDQIDLILTLFQLQNGERLLSDFTNVDQEYAHLKIKDMEILQESLFYDIWWTIYDPGEGFQIYSRKRWEFNPFPIFDYISFEDKI
jgi:aspartyl/asparaginyl-tRNA synthetase